MAAARKGKKRPEVRERKWTDIELKQLAIGLADDKSEFALISETLALKKSANIRIFEQVKKELDARLLEGKDKRKTCQRKESKDQVECVPYRPCHGFRRHLDE